MKYFLKRLGKLFGGLALFFVSFFPLIVGAAFFLGGCDFKEWTAMFTDPNGLPMSEGIMIAIMALVTLVFLISASRHTSKEYGEMVLDVMKKHVEEHREQCTHENFHQIGLTGHIKCDDCGKVFNDMTFLN